MREKKTAIVKKWFDNNGGNTYHSVSSEGKCSGMTYGYGSQYEQTYIKMMGLPSNTRRIWESVDFEVIEVSKRSQLDKEVK